MSAFLVGQKTLDLVALALHENGGADSPTRRGLVDLNAESMRRLYGHWEDIEDGIAQWRKRTRVPNAGRGRKILAGLLPEARAARIWEACRCWAYQSCEGGCHSDPLFKHVVAVSDNLPSQYPVIKSILVSLDDEVYSWGE